MLSLHNIDPAGNGAQTKPAMNLNNTLQTLRRIERLLDEWRSSGDIPAIERDLACDLLRRAYDDILFSNKTAVTASEVSLADNTPADRVNGKAAGEATDTPIDATVDVAVAAGDALNADVVSPVGLAGLAPSGEVTKGIPEESPENAEALEDPTEESAPTEVSAEEPVSIEVSAEDHAKEDTSVVTPVDEPAATEESVEENVPIGTPAGEPVEEDIPVEASVVDVAEEEVSVEEFGEVLETGDAVKESEAAIEESGDTGSPAVDVAVPIPETSADIVIDPVFEVFTDEYEDTDGTEETEDAGASETLGLVKTVNVVEAVDAVSAVDAAEDTDIAGEMELVEEMDAEEMEVVEGMEAEGTEIERPVAASAAIRPFATTAEPNAKPGPESVLTSAKTTAEQTPTDAATSNAETLEEMAARFKNASGRRRKSRRAFLSLYDDDETARRGAPNDQLELSDWGVEPSDSSAKLRHTRELFGLPADDLDMTSEPTPQPAAEADATDNEIEVEVIDFMGDDNTTQSNRNAKQAAESPIEPATEPIPRPTAEPIEPTPHPTVAPAREEGDDAREDLPFDEAIVTLEDLDDAPDPEDASSVMPHLEPLGSSEHSEFSESSDAVSFDSIEIAEIEKDDTQHTDRAEVADKPAKSEVATTSASAAESSAVHDLYDREKEPELPASTTVLGEVLGHDVPTVGDSLGRCPDVTGWTEVADDLNHAISVGDRFVLLRDLFDGDQALCDRTLKRLSTFDDLDDCMIWITENFAWNANSEGAKLIMGLLERKLG